MGLPGRGSPPPPPPPWTPGLTARVRGGRFRPEAKVYGRNWGPLTRAVRPGAQGGPGGAVDPPGRPFCTSPPNNHRMLFRIVKLVIKVPGPDTVAISGAGGTVPTGRERAGGRERPDPRGAGRRTVPVRPGGKWAGPHPSIEHMFDTGKARCRQGVLRPPRVRAACGRADGSRRASLCPTPRRR